MTCFTGLDLMSCSVLLGFVLNSHSQQKFGSLSITGKR